MEEEREGREESEDAAGPMLPNRVGARDTDAFALVCCDCCMCSCEGMSGARFGGLLGDCRIVSSREAAGAIDGADDAATAADMASDEGLMAGTLASLASGANTCTWLRRSSPAPEYMMRTKRARGAAGNKALDTLDRSTWQRSAPPRDSRGCDGETIGLSWPTKLAWALHCSKNAAALEPAPSAERIGNGWSDSST